MFGKAEGYQKFRSHGLSDDALVRQACGERNHGSEFNGFERGAVCRFLDAVLAYRVLSPRRFDIKAQP